MGKTFLYGRANDAKNMIPHADLTVNCPEASIVIAKSCDNPAVLRAISDINGKAIFDKITAGSWVVSLENVDCPPRKLIIIDENGYELFMDYSKLISATVNVTYPIGATVWIENSDTGERYNSTDYSGVWSYTITGAGRYCVNLTYVNGDYHYQASEPFNISENGQVIDVTIEPGRMPLFSYTGEYYICNDLGDSITETDGDWNIRFYTSGIFTIHLLNGANDGIDLDLLDDSTIDASNVLVESGVEYEIVVGGPEGQSSAFGCTATVTGDNGYVSIRNARGGE